MHINLEAAYCHVCQCNQRVKLVQVGTMDVYGEIREATSTFQRKVLQCVRGHVLANLGCGPLPEMTTAATKDNPDLSEIESIKRRLKTLEDYTFKRVTGSTTSMPLKHESPCVPLKHESPYFRND